MNKPILVIGYGNPSRGDDALGCLILESLEQNHNLEQVELITDFQLQIEHALDLQHRQIVLFVDAEVNTKQAYTLTELHAIRDTSFSSHAISPAAVLEVYQNITGLTPPPCFLLSIQAESFELGDDLSQLAKYNLGLASQFALQLLNDPQPLVWRQLINARTTDLPEKTFQAEPRIKYVDQAIQAQQ